MPEPTSAEAADVLAINHLAASYADAVSRREIDEAVLVFAPEGILASPTTSDAVGPQAIAALVKSTTAGLDFVFQTVHSGLVSISGDTARARFPITEWARRTSDGRGIQFLGFYDDELVRLDTGWRFSRRHLVPLTMGKPAFTGRVVPLGGLWTTP